MVECLPGGGDARTTAAGESVGDTEGHVNADPAQLHDNVSLVRASSTLADDITTR